MTNSSENRPPIQKMSSEKYARLKAEAKALYKGLRFFFYLGLGASGFMGAIVFLAKIASGQINASTLANLGLQIGVVALMIGLYRWESEKDQT